MKDKHTATRRAAKYRRYAMKSGRVQWFLKGYQFVGRQPFLVELAIDFRTGCHSARVD
jgi:hypothetical protein